MHTHLGVDSSPELNGATDYNSEKGLILPHLRALDGLNTHDDAYKGTAAGGVTTALVLPGSGNGIGEFTRRHSLFGSRPDAETGTTGKAVKGSL